jgi:two-component system chemotaxis sensor kinase CheA
MTEAAQVSSARQGSSTLRVSSEKVGRVMSLVSELSLAISETLHVAGAAIEQVEGVETAVNRLNKTLRDVQDASLELRLIEVGETFRRLRRVVREIERGVGKTIDLRLTGEDTAIDKVVADRLYEPLVHIVRNAADHGLEPPEDRAAAGKPETGVIALDARQIGSDVRITIRDDGRGLDRAKILARARENGLLGPDETPPDPEIWKLIFAPGFSTADAVTELSGRGVGMDVLNSVMRELRGRITVDSAPGQGTTVTLSIPVSLAFLDCMIMRQGARLYAVPIDTIAEVFRAGAGDCTRISSEGGVEMVHVRDALVPVVRLERLFREAERAPADGAPRAPQVMVVLQSEAGLTGVPMDEITSQQQVVMKPLDGVLGQVRGVQGCALLGSGEVAMILDPERLGAEASA